MPVSDPSADPTAPSPDDIVDELPADLTPEHVGPYRFPDNSRRRVPGLLYVVVGLASAVGSFVAGADASLLSTGLRWGGIGLLLLGLYVIQAGRHLAVDETEALAAASAHIGFPVGHASAQLGWRGLRSRPTWRILLYSADEPPTKRGLVLIDGIDRSVVADLVEDNPEDWTALGGA